MVFKALADPTRRELLDRLHERNGQTLSQLCEGVAMARQSATQHLGVLESANLISTVRHGREKLHYLNPVPLHEIQERWIDKFERPRLRALSAIKQRAEERDMSQPTFVYTTYINSTPEKVWQAITDPELSGQYWGHANVSDWQEGSRWEHRRTDGSGIADVVGTVVESDPPRKLVTTWADPADGADAAVSTVTFLIQPYQNIVRLTVSHADLADPAEYAQASGGWAAVLSNLKSFLETGAPLPTEPWTQPG
ncbi:ArsR family transcriptional regulator [Mycobacteroides abscessus subsp. abscessus]|uniref:Transcriptional regulator, ArsR family n=2 Tax=Mycobacteroides abscessus TaxID=36809 RepID=A0AB74FGK7_9MYCO|nr:SRPBCC domain-containing protein [Mycobacteroides abscessus]EUA64829.1 bacterial regulatory, arsR family protein [Mycobacteroides abscessus 1948]AKP57138.1 ArsR family transcriptional regulator [Mycobacteroides abscessus UC22]ALM15580.1 ArsR family transcriptional regulator [Mycobacteroides abscessus]AMU44647.1 ArsR family transcriptional regulator [Mycobacteroides abscessus]AMU49616.1 ArsR family transcriptional regulator [Mycobacteroides abscessus]